VETIREKTLPAGMEIETLVAVSKRGLPMEWPGVSAVW
jgi:hypothetical protein